MPNPSGPDRDDAPNPPAVEHDAGAGYEPQPDDQVTESYPVSAPDAPDTEAATEVFAAEAGPELEAEQQKPPERRFTAPGFDAGETQIIQSVPEAPTEVFDSRLAQQAGSSKATPQLIPARLARKLPVPGSRSWGWVLALVLIILMLAAIAVLGTVWLTRDSRLKASQEQRVRDSISRFDIAVQNGDLPTLRTLTCGSARDNYLNYNEQAWDDTYRRIAAAKRYPVVASIDEIVVNGDHAEANVTAFMAYAPQTRSTRSFDLQYRDDQWKICQARTD